MSSALKSSKKIFDGASRGVLGGKRDRYRGIIIDEGAIQPTATPTTFKQTLLSSISEYKKEGFRGVWLKLTTDKAHLAGVAVQDAGFKFHHAKDDYIMLTNWLPKD